ncbi:transposable element Tcb2 transposase [Trichonephila clavipes]|nr:transposable element Tcb2 transposase [Trichonephila clavipes]
MAARPWKPSQWASLWMVIIEATQSRMFVGIPGVCGPSVCNILERDRYGGSGVGVCGGIMLNGWTVLQVFDRVSVIGNLYYSIFYGIEHVWDALGRRLVARLYLSGSTQQLKHMLIGEWALLPQELLDNLELSMERRREATIAANRRHISY